jgi:hypothetical protein
MEIEKIKVPNIKVPLYKRLLGRYLEKKLYDDIGVNGVKRKNVKILCDITQGGQLKLTFNSLGEWILVKDDTPKN